MQRLQRYRTWPSGAGLQCRAESRTVVRERSVPDKPSSSRGNGRAANFSGACFLVTGQRESRCNDLRQQSCWELVMSAIVGMYDICAKEYRYMSADDVLEVRQCDERYLSEVDVWCDACAKKYTLYINTDASTILEGLELAKRGGDKNPKYKWN
jgi:hypothetical protein